MTYFPGVLPPHPGPEDPGVHQEAGPAGEHRVRHGAGHIRIHRILIRVSINIHMYMFIYIYIHIHIHTYTHIHIYTNI